MPKTGDIKSTPRLTPFFSDKQIEIGLYKRDGMVEYVHAKHKPSGEVKRFDVIKYDIKEAWHKMERWFETKMK